VSEICRRRPGIPIEYGIDTDDAGMLDWDDVAAALASAEVYWVSTVHPSGAPHLIPIWGAFTDAAAYIEGGDMTRWARNLAEGDGRVHIGADHDGMQVMVRGAAVQTTVSPETQAAIADGYEAKYPYRPSGADFWMVTPDNVLAWMTNDLEAFGSTPTQFDFGGPT
jgi:hypothetical protein